MCLRTAVRLRWTDAGPEWYCDCCETYAPRVFLIPRGLFACCGCLPLVAPAVLEERVRHTTLLARAIVEESRAARERRGR